MLASGDTSQLLPVFLGGLLDALQQTLDSPESGAGLAWGLHEGAGAWLWYDRHELAAAAQQATLEKQPPAFLILDGSALEDVNERLFAPWPIKHVILELPLSPVVTVVQCSVTGHTRAIVQDSGKLRRLAQHIGTTAHKLNLTLDGGITFMAARETMSELLGGEWLHYGGQRGRNDLAAARTLALVGSPTVPPDALERQALALWGDSLTTNAQGALWERHGPGDYRAIDPHLAAIDALHGPEELRQAAHRARLILAEEAKTVLVFSPWELEALGLTPHQTITQLPTTHSREGREAWQAYRARIPAGGLMSSPSLETGGSVQVGTFSTCFKDIGSLPHVEKPQTCTQPDERHPEPRAAQQKKEHKPPAGMRAGRPLSQWDTLTAELVALARRGDGRAAFERLQEHPDKRERIRLSSLISDAIMEYHAARRARAAAD